MRSALLILVLIVSSACASVAPNRPTSIVDIRDTEMDALFGEAGSATTVLPQFRIENHNSMFLNQKDKGEIVDVWSSTDSSVVVPSGRYLWFDNTVIKFLKPGRAELLVSIVDTKTKQVLVTGRRAVVVR